MSLLDLQAYRAQQRRMHHPYAGAQGRLTLRRFSIPGDRASRVSWHVRSRDAGPVHLWQDVPPSQPSALQPLSPSERWAERVGIALAVMFCGVLVLLLSMLPAAWFHLWPFAPTPEPSHVSRIPSTPLASPAPPSLPLSSPRLWKSSRWVTVENSRIPNGNGEFRHGDMCLLLAEASIQSLGRGNDQRSFAYYQVHIAYPAFGTLCPDGTVFVVPVTEKRIQNEP